MASGKYNRKIMPLSAWKKHRGGCMKSNPECFRELRQMGWEVYSKINLIGKPKLFVLDYLDGRRYQQCVYLAYGRGLIAIAIQT
jgi:hypothetical protein